MPSASLSRRSLLLSPVCGLLACGARPAQGRAVEEAALPLDILPPERIQVLPVFFAPTDQPLPTPEQQAKLMRHLTWARRRFAELLHDVTFEIAGKTPQGGPVPLSYRGKRPLDYYRGQLEGGSPAYVSELLDHLGLTRFNCPYILVTITMNTKDDYPHGGGRSINGGYNTGGGVVNMSSFGLDRVRNFQSTLQHELGHSFGLTHVDQYGYDMSDSPSMMSYNPTNHTKGFEPAAKPAILAPEDIRALALNQRVLRGATFVPGRDVPPGYPIAPEIQWIVPMPLVDGHPGWKIEVVSEDGQEYGSAPGNIVQRRICANLPAPGGPPATRFDPRNMWQSRNVGAGQWARLTLTFPVEATLDEIAVYSEHSARHHRVVAVRGHALYGGDLPGPTLIRSVKLPGPEARVRFPRTKARMWRLAFQANETGAVVLRGLRFFVQGKEVFPPSVPPEGDLPPLA